jgi:recombination protein RecR
MSIYPKIINDLISSFSELPGIGRKAAERFVFYLIKQDAKQIDSFAQNLQLLKQNNFICPTCFNFSEAAGQCNICLDSKRDKNIICVVESFYDLNVIDATAEYNGMYHVLGGKIDPPEGITPDKLKIAELVQRIKHENIQEVILALNPDLAGEGTIIHLKNILRPLNIKLTILARGLPMGANIEYADEATLSNALKGRREIN